MNNRGENIRRRAYDFALGVVKHTRKFPRNTEGFIVTSQLIRSATSIPANIYEGSGGVSRKEFIQFISVAKKSAIETNFWIHFSFDLGFLTNEEHETLSQECLEIVKIVSRIILNARK